MTVTLNGKFEDVGKGTTLGHLLGSKNLNPNTTVVELNQRILKREEFEDTILHEHDVVELLRMVGGG